MRRVVTLVASVAVLALVPATAATTLARACWPGFRLPPVHLRAVDLPPVDLPATTIPAATIPGYHYYQYFTSHVSTDDAYVDGSVALISSPCDLATLPGKLSIRR